MENEVTREEDRIREEMKETRSSLTDKLEKLEEKVSTTVEGATGTVTDTIQAVKDTVKDTTSAVTETVGAIKDSVKDTVGAIKESVAEGIHGLGQLLNLHKQAERHPCAVFTGSIIAGFVGGKLLFPASAPAASSATPPYPPRGQDGGNGHPDRLASKTREASAEESAPGWLGNLKQEFGAEISQVKNLALGMLVQGIKDLLVHSLPAPWKPQVEQIVTRIGAKLTGQEAENEASGKAERSTAQAQPSSGPWSVAADKYTGAGTR